MTTYSTTIASEHRFLLNAAAGPLWLIDPIGLADLLNYARDNGEVQIDLVLDELAEAAWCSRHQHTANGTNTHHAWCRLTEAVQAAGIHNGETDHLDAVLSEVTIG